MLKFVHVIVSGVVSPSRGWTALASLLLGVALAEVATSAAISVLLLECLNRQLWFPISAISQWRVSLSSDALVMLALPNILAHLAKPKLMVITALVRSYLC